MIVGSNPCRGIDFMSLLFCVLLSCVGGALAIRLFKSTFDISLPLSFGGGEVWSTGAATFSELELRHFASQNGVHGSF